MKNVLVVLPVEERHKARLEAAGKGCNFVYSSHTGVSEEQVAQANIIIGCVPAAYIKASEKLELLQTNTAGVDQYMPKGILHEKTVLTNSTGAYSKAVSEHGLAQTLMLQKKLHLYRDAQFDGNWTDEGQVSSMSDATVLVVGLGEIGCAYAKMVKALGAYVIGLKRRASDCPEYVDELYTTDEIDKLLPRADVIFSVLPETKQTIGFFSLERFKLMKKSAIFVNCGRGSAVKMSVLEQAIKEKLIASAAIDVCEVEPLPADHPCWKLRNLVITPHVSGFYHLPETFERIVDISEYNLAAFLEGRELKNIIDFETGYKK